MIAVEDFTKLAEGTDVALEGRVGRCPRCGRSGIEHRGERGIDAFVHMQKSQILSDGLLVEPTDCCRVPDA